MRGFITVAALLLAAAIVAGQVLPSLPPLGEAAPPPPSQRLNLEVVAELATDIVRGRPVADGDAGLYRKDGGGEAVIRPLANRVEVARAYKGGLSPGDRVPLYARLTYEIDGEGGQPPSGREYLYFLRKEESGERYRELGLSFGGYPIPLSEEELAGLEERYGPSYTKLLESYGLTP